MLKLAHYLKKSTGFIILIIGFLFLQAYCDLALPEYTSNIVNVGISQDGVEDAVPTTIRSQSLEQLTLFLSQEEQDKIKEYYTLEDNYWKLDQVSKEERQELNDIFIPAMTMVSMLDGDTEETKAIKQEMGLPQDTNILEMVSHMPEVQRTSFVSNMGEKIKSVPNSMLEQGAIAYVKKEYEEQGLNLQQMQKDYIKKAAVQMIGIALVIMVASVLVTLFSSRIAATFAKDVREDVYKKVISFSSAEMNQFSIASLITRSTNDIQQIQLVMSMIFRIILYAPILGIGGVMKVLKTNTSMAWIIGVAVGMIFVVILLLFSVAMPKFKLLQKLVDKMNLVTREILTGLSVIRAFGTEEHEKDRFQDANATLTKTNVFVNRCMTFMMPLMTLIMNVITILIVYVGAYHIDDGTMQVGDIMAFIQYTMQIIMAFLMFTMLSIMLPRATVASTRIHQVLSTKNSIVDPSNDTNKSQVETKEKSVEFRDVSFAYPDAQKEVLSHINFVAKQGETTAIIGSTGSGKSTLVNLIPRFFDVTKGQVLVNGIDVREMTQKQLRDKLGYVPQKAILFSGTIESNVCYGDKAISTQMAERAIEIAQATEFVKEKEQGMQSPISQGGSNVSGGQKQRLSIARAIAKNPEIYIFDDSFSALDYKTDVALRRALRETTKEAVTIIVAQRISTILHAEQIIVLDEGKIVGKGNHEQLMKECEVYRQIAMSQLSEKELSMGKEVEDR